MLPTLAPGDQVLVDRRAYTGSSPQIGDIVVVPHPYVVGTRLIKRVARVTEDGRLWLARCWSSFKCWSSFRCWSSCGSCVGRLWLAVAQATNSRATSSPVFQKRLLK